MSAAGRYGGKISETTFARFYVTSDDFASNRLYETGEDGKDSWQPMQTGFRMDGEPSGTGEWTVQGDLYDNEGDQKVVPYWTSDSSFPGSLDDKLDTKGAICWGGGARSSAEIGHSLSKAITITTSAMMRCLSSSSQPSTLISSMRPRLGNGRI
jgi:hypothetical protein